MRVGLVSTYNVECGISTYSEHLTQHFPEGQVQIFGNELGILTDTGECTKHPINRCWRRTGNFKELTEAILKSEVDVVHFQHEFGLFQDNYSFCRMLETLRTFKKSIAITFHTVFTDPKYNDKIREMAPYVNVFICHTEEARTVLGAERSAVIPHGSVRVRSKPREESRKYLNIPEDKIVVLSFGFITPTKGAMDSISAIHRLRYDFSNLFFLLVGFPVVHGNNYSNLEYCLKLFKRTQMLGLFDVVHIYPKYVSEKEIDYYAGASDIAIENYYQTQYSISGMSHLVMSYGLPSISSRSNILMDLDNNRSLKYDIGNIEQMTNNLRILIKTQTLGSGYLKIA
jgi:glycosyltransferase involved in cell wall biosynthesis